MTPPFGHRLWLFLGGIVAFLAGIKLIKRQGTMEERNRRAAQDAEAKIEINNKLNEMREAENDLADKAQDAGRNPGPSASDELSDKLSDLTFGRTDREG